VNALNAKRPASAEFVEWPDADHSLYTYADERKAFGRDADKKYDPELTHLVLEWLKKNQEAAHRIE
jgi:hypothetical protein